MSLGFRIVVHSDLSDYIGLYRDISALMELQMQNHIEHDMEARTVWRLLFLKIISELL